MRDDKLIRGSVLHLWVGLLFYHENIPYFKFVKRKELEKGVKMKYVIFTVMVFCVKVP